MFEIHLFNQTQMHNAQSMVTKENKSWSGSGSGENKFNFFLFFLFSGELSFLNAIEHYSFWVWVGETVLEFIPLFTFIQSYKKKMPVSRTQSQFNRIPSLFFNPKALRK